MMWLARLKPLVAVAATLIVVTAGVAVQGANSPRPRERGNRPNPVVPRKPAQAPPPLYRTSRPTGTLPGSSSP